MRPGEIPAILLAKLALAEGRHEVVDGRSRTWCRLALIADAVRFVRVLAASADRGAAGLDLRMTPA